MNINELRKNINHQTRNGRLTVYLPVSTIKELDERFESDNEFEYVDAHNIEKLLREYERTHFKESLKVDTSHNMKLSKVEGKNYTFERIEQTR